jgi:hypothetical protein
MADRKGISDTPKEDRVVVYPRVGCLTRAAGKEACM